MYNMRYHLASLISVFLALAIGLVLGGLITEGTEEGVQETLLESIQRDITQTRESNVQLRNDNVIAFNFADMLLDDFKVDKLDGRVILVIGTEGREAQMAISDLEAAGATTLLIVPEHNIAENTWAIKDNLAIADLEFHGIVNTYVPTGEDHDTAGAAAAAGMPTDGTAPGSETGDATTQYLSEYFVYLRELQDQYNVPIVFAALEDAESNLITYAWDEGFSGTNQLGNRYGAYTLIVLLASDTEGKYGSDEAALALYPPIPEHFTLLEPETSAEADTEAPASPGTATAAESEEDPHGEQPQP